MFSPEPDIDIKQLKKRLRNSKLTKPTFYQKLKSLLRWRWSYKGWRHKKKCSCSDCVWSVLLSRTPYNERNHTIYNSETELGPYTKRWVNIIKKEMFKDD